MAYGRFDIPGECRAWCHAGERGWVLDSIRNADDNSPALDLEDYAALPDKGRRYELHDGELSVTPAPGLDHQDILGNLVVILRTHVNATGLGKVFFAPVDCHDPSWRPRFGLRELIEDLIEDLYARSVACWTATAGTA